MQFNEATYICMYGNVGVLKKRQNCVDLFFFYEFSEFLITIFVENIYKKFSFEM